MKMMKHRGLSLREKIGYSILAVYAIAALIFVVFCISLDTDSIYRGFRSCPGNSGSAVCDHAEEIYFGGHRGYTMRSVYDFLYSRMLLYRQGRFYDPQYFINRDADRSCGRVCHAG